MTVNRDLATLHDMLQRLIPGSRINAEMMGENVRSGSVLSPVDANRAAELAARFIKKKDGVVNMLDTATKEQVLLKVQVAEMHRDAAPVRRRSAGRGVESRRVHLRRAIQNTFPTTSAIVPEVRPIGIGAVPAVAAGGALQPTWQSGSQRVTAVQALERARCARSPSPRHGHFGRDGQVPGRRRVPGADRAGQQHAHCRVEAVRYQRQLQAGRHDGGAHQPQHSPPR